MDVRARDGIRQHCLLAHHADAVPARLIRRERASPHGGRIRAGGSCIVEVGGAARPSRIDASGDDRGAEHAGDRVVLVARLLIGDLGHRRERHESTMPRGRHAEQVRVEAGVAVIAEHQDHAANGEVPLRKCSAELACVDSGDDERKAGLDEVGEWVIGARGGNAGNRAEGREGRQLEECTTLHERMGKGAALTNGWDLSSIRACGRIRSL